MSITTVMTEHMSPLEVTIKDPTWSSRNLPRGRNGGLICEETNEEFHSDYHPETTGFLSYRKQMWFSSTFYHNLHSWKSHISPYDKPETRSQFMSIFEKYA